MMLNILILLIAVINLGKTQDTPEVDDVAILSGLASSSLECSLKFNRAFIQSNEAVATAIEQLLDASRDSKAIREPRRRKQRKRGEDATTEAPEEIPVVRRNLRKDRGATREPLADGETRAPRPTREPREMKDRKATREPLADGETRAPRPTREPRGPCECDEDEDEATEAPVLRRLLERDGDSTTEPLEGETRKSCNCGRGRGKRRKGGKGRGDSDSEDDATTAAPESEEAQRRALKARRRGDRPTREPFADGETREPRATREPCEGEECGKRERPSRGERKSRRGDRPTPEPLADGETRAPREGTKEPRRRRDADSTKEPCDKDEETTEVSEATEAPVLRRALKGNRRGDRPTREPLADGETREPRRGKDSSKEPLADGETRAPREGTKEPRVRRDEASTKERRRRGADSTKEPCDKDDETTEASEATEAPVLQRALKGKRRGDRPTREPLADGQTREPRRRKDSTKEPLADGETRAPREGTKEPRMRRDRDSRRRRDDDATKEPCDTEETTEASEATEAPVLRRALKGKRRGDRPTREPLADGQTREPRRRKDSTKEPLADGETRAPREGTKEPRMRRDRDSTKEPRVDGETREPREGTKQPRMRRERRRRKDSDDEETTEAPAEVALRRNLRKGGRKGRGRSVEALMANGSLDFGGLTGEVAFGVVDENLESIPLTLTIEGITFECDVEVRGDSRVFCRASSEDNFKVRVSCALNSEL